MRAVFLCLIAAFSFSFPLLAQDAAQPALRPYTMHRNVALVVLDGVVIDAKGRPVTDLKQSEFHIAEDGAPQTIRNFEAPGKFTPAADLTINSTADLDRLAPRAPVNIVALDEFSTRFEDMAFARYSLKKWLEAQPAKLDTPTMLVAVSLDKFTVLSDYTQSKDTVLTSLDKHFAAYPWHFNQITWTAENFTAAHMALRRVAEATAGHQGHKTIIWVGRGLQSNRGGHHSIDMEVPADSTTSHTLDELRDARVTLYTIDPAGVMSDPDGAYPGAWWPFGGDRTFQALARATGGRNFYGRNDVDAEIGSSIRDGQSFYALSYVPPDPDNDPKKLRKIKVTLDRPGLTFISRKAYYPQSHPARVDEDGDKKKSNRAATEILSAGLTNLQYDGVSFKVTASPTDANALHLHVDPEGIGFFFPKDGRQPYTKLTILTSLFDKKDKELKRDARVLTFTVPQGMEIAKARKVPMNFDVQVPADNKGSRLRVVVRVEGSGRMGTADLPYAAGSTGESSKSQSNAGAAAGAP